MIGSKIDYSVKSMPIIFLHFYVSICYLCF